MTTLQSSASPLEREEASPRAPTRDKTNSDVSVAQKNPSGKFPLYRLVGYVNGVGIYLPKPPSTRGLAIERLLATTSYLGKISPEELEAWFAQRLRAETFLEHLR